MHEMIYKLLSSSTLAAFYNFRQQAADFCFRFPSDPITCSGYDWLAEVLQYTE